MKHIILAADDNYAIPCMVTIASILSNNVPENCNINVLTEGFNEENTKLFEKLRQEFVGASINIVVVDKALIKGAIVTERFPISNFFRLLVPMFFDFDKALYMDCDIIVNDDISELWNTDLGDMACGIIEDQACEDITLHNRIHTFTPYYNAGVLLMNLDVWRKENISQRLVEYMKDYPERCLYPDQDAINAILVGKLMPLPYRFNFQERWYEPQQHWLMHRDKWEAIEEAKKKPAILHYTGPQKPWMEGCSHPLAMLFFKYKKFVVENDTSEEDDRIKTQQAQARDKENRERRRRHKHIRRANLFTILFAVETIAFILYILLS